MILFILFLLSNLSESINNSNEAKFYSQLLGMVNTRKVYNSMPYIPYEGFNILQMCNQMKKVINVQFKFNDAEVAYQIYYWITQNIRIDEENFRAHQEGVDPFYTGKGTLSGITSFFIIMCNYMGYEAGIISGYKKLMDSEGKILNDDYAWNYIIINGTYYLIDLISAIREKKEELFFATDPEIFIKFHIPKESKWQLLSESITLEKFNSMAYLTTDFYYLGFKNIFPDSLELKGIGTILLNYDESYTDFVVKSIIKDKNNETISFNQHNYFNDVVEIKYDLKNDYSKLEINIGKNNGTNYYPIVTYTIK